MPEFIVAFMDRGLLCDEGNLTAIFNIIKKKGTELIGRDDLKLTLPVLSSENDINLE